MKRVSIFRTMVVSLSIILLPPSAWAADSGATEGELHIARQWLKTHLLECKIESPTIIPLEVPKAPIPRLEVLANHDPVIPNSRGPRPLTLGSTQYRRGLYCHAVSRVVVYLPSPGKTFSSVIGVDSNPDTSRGCGSVVFSVRMGDKVAFASDVLRHNSPAQQITVDLSGADRFILEVGDGGDGISCDQADWADAKVFLADGTELWLGDMPLIDTRAQTTLTSFVRSNDLPFSFVYGDKTSDELLAAWPMTIHTKKLDNTRTEHLLAWIDSSTGLECRCRAVEYADWPVVEWTLYFKNTGEKNTPILKNILGLNSEFQREAQGEFVLHAWKGDTCAPDLYQPMTLTLGPNARQRFAPAGGRGSNLAFPYYNLTMPGGGMLMAIGWPGQWASSFVRDDGRNLQILAGQELTNMVLQPGEQVRSPLSVLFFWKGTDIERSHNLWRRWMWACNVPRTADGKLPPWILFGNTSLEFNEMTGANEENQKYFIDRYKQENIRIDYWWMDAGWYPCNGQWPITGTWEPDLARFPKGLRAISDHGLSVGVKTLVWFEPERVAGGTWISTNHPEWLLGSTLLNLGNPKALSWLTDHVDRVLREQRIHLYRQDFNMDPLAYWRNHDAADRQGVTENLHVQGYLAYWDGLRRRHPNLIIDSCASGGRRNDLETMRRAVALHPTDYNYSHLAVKQAFHYSLFQWLPYYASNTLPIETVDTYAIRSGYAPAVVLGYDLRHNDLDTALLRTLTEQWREITPFYSGDFYPLTPYSIEENQWLGWQFSSIDGKQGCLQVFRRPANDEPTRTFRLKGLDPAAQYELKDFDTTAAITQSGRDLMEKGITVTIPSKPGTGVFVFSKK